MRLPVFRLPVASLGSFIESLRSHGVSLRITLPNLPGEFECRIRRGLSSVTTHGYRLGDEFRFDFIGSEPLSSVVRDIIYGCGGSQSDDDTFLAGWEIIEAAAGPNANDRSA